MKLDSAKRAVVWIIGLGEPLPLHGPQVRLMRAGMLAQEFASRGADTTWWSSSFCHSEKRYVAEQKEEVNVLDGVTLRFLHGRPYNRNISLARIGNHKDVAKHFTQLSSRSIRPDLIFCSYPTIELAHAAVNFGRKIGSPVIVDVRDLWPEVFMDLLPFPRPLLRVALSRQFAKARDTLSQATAITAISEPFLEKSLHLARRRRTGLDRVVPLAYSRSEPNPVARTSAISFWRKQGLALDGTELIACAFGNLSNVPEFSTAVQAIEHLDSNVQKKMRMVICGSGDKLEWLQRQAKNIPQLIVPGRVGQAEIASLMEFSKVGMLVYPNRRDFLISFPNKIGEYLSRSLPIISTLDGETGKLLRQENIGTVTPSGNAKSFAVNLQKLLTLNRTVEHRIQLNAKRVFKDYFDSDEVHGSLLNHLEEHFLGNCENGYIHSKTRDDLLSKIA